MSAITSTVVVMTPKRAAEYLNNNTKNRPLRSGLVERYAADMARDQWVLNGEPIIIASNGDLLDGQHRLYAVVESGCSVRLLVTEGVDAAHMRTIDTGIARTYGDIASMRKLPYAQHVASTLRMCYWYMQERDKKGFMHSRPSHTDLDVLLKALPELPERVAEACSRNAALRVLPASILSFVYFGACRYDMEQARVWLDGIATGTELSSRNAVHALRERMFQNAQARAKLGREEVAALALKSWNHYVEGRGVQVLKWSKVEGFPAFYGESKKTAAKPIRRLKAVA